MNNKEKAKEIAYENSFFGRFIMDRIEVTCLEMAQWKDEQVKQLLIEKTNHLSSSAAQDSVKRCTIEGIYRELFNEEIPSSNPYKK